MVRRARFGPVCGQWLSAGCCVLSAGRTLHTVCSVRRRQSAVQTALQCRTALCTLQPPSVGPSLLGSQLSALGLQVCSILSLQLSAGNLIWRPKNTWPDLICAPHCLAWWGLVRAAPAPRRRGATRPAQSRPVAHSRPELAPGQFIVVVGGPQQTLNRQPWAPHTRLLSLSAPLWQLLLTTFQQLLLQTKPTSSRSLHVRAHPTRPQTANEAAFEHSARAATSTVDGGPKLHALGRPQTVCGQVGPPNVSHTCRH